MVTVWLCSFPTKVHYQWYRFVLPLFQSSQHYAWSDRQPNTTYITMWTNNVYCRPLGGKYGRNKLCIIYWKKDIYQSGYHPVKNAMRSSRKTHETDFSYELQAVVYLTARVSSQLLIRYMYRKKPANMFAHLPGPISCLKLFSKSHCKRAYYWPFLFYICPSKLLCFRYMDDGQKLTLKHVWTITICTRNLVTILSTLPCRP